jgi:cytochrome b561/polyisoprenoid-binding protein YceI
MIGMTIQNTTKTYGKLSRALHWITALMILLMLPLGFVAQEAAENLTTLDADQTDAAIARVTTLFSLHKTIGVLLFFLAMIRLIWMLSQPKPGLLHPNRKLESFAAESVHFALYGALILVPLSGWLHHAATTGFAPIWWPFGQSLPFIPQDASLARLFSALHGLSTWGLIAALVLHIAGALKHHLIDRDTTLLRMLRGHEGAPAAKHRSIMPGLTAVLLWSGIITVALQTSQIEAKNQPQSTLSQIASEWQVQDGALNIAIEQMGSTVKGSFADWTARISYDQDIDATRKGEITITVAIQSLTLGSVTEKAMEKDFFDAALHPTATFSADIFKRDAGLVAEGTLTIKGKSMPLSLPFDLLITGDTAKASGQTSLNRFDAGIGLSVNDTATLAPEVVITFDLTAVRS